MEKILVIEDDAAVQRALRRTFESAGFDVSIASDGMMAMETFRATMPRLVILDLRLPGKSGQDLCREIKHESSNVPILVSERGQRCPGQGSAAGTRGRRLRHQAF